MSELDKEREVYFYRDEPGLMYGIVQSSYCTCETNLTLYVSTFLNEGVNKGGER